MKMLVVASSYGQFVNFCRKFELNYFKEALYITDVGRTFGYKMGTPLIILEGYEYNPKYTIGDMFFLGWKFEPTFISEREIYNENIIF